MASAVLTVAGSIVTSTVVARRSSGTVTVPEKPENEPRTLLIMRCLTENATDECAASMVQVPGVRSLGVGMMNS